MSTLASVVIRDVIANLPAAGIPGRLFFASDTGAALRDNGTSWDTVTAGGGITQLTGDVTAGPGSGSQAATVVATHLTAPLPVAQGGTGTATPSLVAGTNVTISGSWPDQTVSAAGAGASGLVIGFALNTGAVGTNVAPMVPAARAATLSRVAVVTKSSDSSVPFQFDILLNGTSIFTGTLPTVPAATASGTVTIFTGLTTVPLSVAQDNVFSINVIQGNANWQVTVQAET